MRAFGLVLFAVMVLLVVPGTAMAQCGHHCHKACSPCDPGVTKVETAQTETVAAPSEAPTGSKAGCCRCKAGCGGHKCGHGHHGHSCSGHHHRGHHGCHGGCCGHHHHHRFLFFTWHCH